MQEIRKYVFAQSSEVVRCNFNNPVHVTDPTMRRLFKEGVSQKPSSMLAITFASSNSIIVWFRDTQTWTRQWVGNPNQRLVTDSIGEQHLHPNIHFRCQEESLEEPLPWSVKDMAVARNIRQGVNELKARRLGELEVINKELQQEIRERKQQELIIRRMLEDRQTLLKEVHHRVKNNLQIISSLLNLSVTSYDIHDSIALDLLVESDNRIRSMALIHEVLYRSDDLSTVSGGAYMHQLSTHLGKTYKRPFVKVRVQAEENIQFNIDTAVSFGFLMNELITNCYKHAFDNEMQGSVVLQLQEENDTTFILKVSDNGPGADKLQQAIGLKEVTNGDAIQKGMGLRLVEDMVRQLRGTLTVDDTFIDGISQGTTVTVVFEQIVYKERLTPSSKQARVRK
jgi:two-component sensor histidine kinase